VVGRQILQDQIFEIGNLKLGNQGKDTALAPTNVQYYARIYERIPVKTSFGHAFF
jgi:hypothetical protein